MRFAHLSLVCALALPACVISPALARAGFTTLTFDDLPAAGYSEGTPIPAADQLSDQLVGTYGVSFRSGSPFVGVVDLGVGHATSGTNGLSRSTPTGLVTYSDQFPISMTFYDPADPGRAAATDYVSVRGDLRGLYPTYTRYVTLAAFDVGGEPDRHRPPAGRRRGDPGRVRGRDPLGPVQWG